MTNTAEMAHFLSKARDAARGGRDAWSVQSTGEKVAVALVLNRADWLAGMGYTLTEAIDRAGPEWVALMPAIARQLQEDEENSSAEEKEHVANHLGGVTMQYDAHFTDALQAPFFAAMRADPEIWFIQARTTKGEQLLTFRGSHPGYAEGFLKAAAEMRKEAS